MITVFIAMDPCTKVNGGLQVIVIWRHLLTQYTQDKVVHNT